MHLKIQRVSTLSPKQWDQLWEFTAAYTETSRSFFEAMLRTKSHVGLVYTDARRETLVGTSSIDTRLIHFEGEEVVLIYTGDVLLREDVRGHNIFQRIGLISFLRARMRHPLKKIYWFLGASSHQAYLVLVRNLATYWPRPERPTPPTIERLRDVFARAVMPELWDAQQGTFRTGGTKLLRSFAKPLTPKEREDPHIQFFVEKNPNFAKGDLLGCVACLDLENWISILKKSAARQLKHKKN